MPEEECEDETNAAAHPPETDNGTRTDNTTSPLADESHQAMNRNVPFFSVMKTCISCINFIVVVREYGDCGTLR